MSVARLSLRPEAADVRVARDFCTSRVAAALPDRIDGSDLVDDVAMVTSELVTNAIRAGASHIELTLDVAPPEVRIAVVDDADGTVQVATPGPLDTNGRGLRIVADLADNWGVEPHPGGKTVWAALDWTAMQGPDDTSVPTNAR